MFVPAVLVNSFSILAPADQQRRTKLWDAAEHLISSCSVRGRGTSGHTAIDMQGRLTDEVHLFTEEGSEPNKRVHSLM